VTVRSSILAALGALAMLTVGCGDETLPTVSPDAACTAGAPRSYVVSTLGFTRVDPKTMQAPGFDVDGIVSDGKDATSCFKADFADAAGDEGIDNQLAVLIPDVEKILGNAVDGLIQGAINDGELLILLTVDGAASTTDAACVNLTAEVGKGRPSLDTAGVIEAYQTFDLNTKAEVSHGKGGKIEGNVLTIGPFELAIPIAIFDVSFVIHVHRARFRFTIDPDDGTLKDAILGGGIVPQEILDGVKQGAGVFKYIPILSLVLNQQADLEPDADGKCQQVSAALSFTGVEAFVRR
jgi:hypothetical protein